MVNFKLVVGVVFWGATVLAVCPFICHGFNIREGYENGQTKGVPEEALPKDCSLKKRDTVIFPGLSNGCKVYYSCQVFSIEEIQRNPIIDTSKKEISNPDSNTTLLVGPNIDVGTPKEENCTGVGTNGEEHDKLDPDAILFPAEDNGGYQNFPYNIWPPKIIESVTNLESRIQENSGSDPEAILFPGQLGNRVGFRVAEKWCNNYKKVCNVDNSNVTYQPTNVEEVPAREGEFPHMAAIGYGERKSIMWNCAGTLISENFVLTAASCVYENHWGPANWVRLGDVTTENKEDDSKTMLVKGQTHPVLKRILPPEYDMTSKINDVALLKIGNALESNFLPTVSKSIHPACIQVNDEIPYVATATGWGNLDYGDIAPFLKKVPLLILKAEECNRTSELDSKVLKTDLEKSQICASDLSSGNITCKVERGSPLQTEEHQGSCLHNVIGIASYGELCNTNNSSAIYARVSHFLDWIEENVWSEV